MMVVHLPPRPANPPPCDCLNWCGDDTRIHSGHARACDRMHAQLLQAALERSAYNIADQESVAIIRSEAVATTLDGLRWLDCGPMCDEREVDGASADFNRQLVGYALARRLVVAHHRHNHVVRIVADTPPTEPRAA